MGRNRTPTDVLEARGSFDRHPERRRARGVVFHSGPIGDPPAYFDDVHRAVWRELVDEAPPGFLQRSDGMLVELTTRLFVRMRSDNGRPRPWRDSIATALVRSGADEREIAEFFEEVEQNLRVSGGEARLLTKCLSAMGFTPAARSRLNGR